MKGLILFCLLICFFGASQSFGQSLVVPNKVIYTRKGKNVPANKKTFEVTYPVVVGISSETVAKNLNESLSYWKAFDTTLDKNINQHHWLSRLSFRVNFSNRRLLDITLIMEGSGAYPDGVAKTLVVDLNTGNRLAIGDVFTNVGDLVVKIDKARQIEIKNARNKARQIGKKDSVTFNQLLGSTRFRINRLDQFSISDQGVTFIYDYGFPYSARHLEPEGRYRFTWKEMSPFIKTNGPLIGFLD